MLINSAGPNLISLKPSDPSPETIFLDSAGGTFTGTEGPEPY